MQLAALLKRQIDARAHEAATSPFNLRAAPTPAQAEAGNYRKGHVEIGPRKTRIAIENPQYSHRKPEWPPLTAHYGYVKGSEGADGDEIDCFLNPGMDDAWNSIVYVIDQPNADGSFDEHKAMIGYPDQQSAIRDYEGNYPSDFKVGPVTQMSLNAFDDWAKSPAAKMPLAMGKAWTQSASATTGITNYHAQDPDCKCAKCKLKRLVVSKGDVAGHEFHGNQWTGGSGGGSRLDRAQARENAMSGLDDKERGMVDTLIAHLADSPHSLTPQEFADKYYVKPGTPSPPIKKDFIDVYHGTASTLVDSIKAKGLIPAESKGGDFWAKTHGMAMGHVATDKATASVFFTDQKKIAGSFARIATEVNGGKPVLIDIKMPRDEYAKSFIDPDFAQANKPAHAFKLQDTIKPEWITSVEPAKSFDPRIHAGPRMYKADDVELFAVIVADGMEKGDVAGHEFHGNQHTGSLGGAGQLKSMFERLSQPDGGFTYSPSLKTEPKGGYALSIHPEASAVYDAKSISYLDLVKYAARNHDLLSQPGNHIGGWHDPASGKIFLDVSMVTSDRAKAESLALKHDQLAYFDLHNFTSVTVNPHATSGGLVNKADSAPLGSDRSPVAGGAIREDDWQAALRRRIA